VAGLSSDYRISNVTRLDSTGFVDSAPVYQETAGYASAYPIAEASTVEAIGASTAEAIGAVALL
jgi:hypothetical protein